jgi:hypothetical protein
MDSCPIPSRPRSVAARSREACGGRKAECANSILWAEFYQWSDPPHVYTGPGAHTHTQYCTSVCPIFTKKTRDAHARTPRSVAASARPTTRRPEVDAMDAGDDRESATRGRRREATSDGANGRPCREGYRTGYSPCSRCERRRDETDE